MRVGEYARTPHQRSLLPVGAAIQHDHASGGQGRALTKTGPDEWTSTEGETRGDDSPRYNSDTNYRITSLPDTPGVVIGDWVNTGPERATCPVGTEVTYRINGRVWRKTGVDLWHRVDREDRSPDRTDSLGGWSTDPALRQGYQITALPTEPPIMVAGRVLVPGVTLATHEEFEALPVGTVVQLNTVDARRYTKVGPGDWLDHTPSGDQPFREHEFSLGMNTIVTLGDTAPSITPLTQEGTTMTLTMTELEALPLESTVRLDTEVWTRTTGGLRHTNGTELGLHNFTGAITEGRITATPPAPAVTQVDVELAKMEGARERDEEFLSVLREHWDGATFTEGEINEVLDDLGLPNIEEKETITVSLNVSAHYTLTEDECENVLGDSSVSISDPPTIYWDYDVEVETEVTQGECGCGDASFDSLSDYVEARYDDWEVTGRSCPND